MKKLMSAGILALTCTLNVAGVLVTDISGRVETAEKRIIGILSEIADGTRLDLPTGAQLVALDLTSGREYVVVGPGQFRVEKDGVHGVAGAHVMPRQLPASNLPAVKISVGRVSRASMTMRGGFSSSGPSPLYPARTAVLTVTPSLRWSPVEGATTYRVTITDDAGMIILDSRTSGEEMRATSAAGLLGGKQYALRVEALGAQGRIADASTTFSVVTDDAARLLDQIKPDRDAPFSQRVLYAAQLQEAGAVDEARLLWQALAKERPDIRSFIDLAQ